MRHPNWSSVLRRLRPWVVCWFAVEALFLPVMAWGLFWLLAIQDGPLIAVGGRPFLDDPELAEQVGADLTATNAAEAAARLREHFER